MRVKLPAEVPVSIRIRGLSLGLLALSLGSPALAQQFGVGATYGWFNDVEHTFRLENFRSPAWEGWIESRLGEEASLRVTYGALHAPGDNVGQTVGPSESPIVMPEYRDRIQYITLSVSYLFRDGPLTTELFAGIGGYGIRPESISPAADPFRDARERVFGWHAGVDGSLHLSGGFSLVGRVAFHGIQSQTRRSLLIASTGAAYRF